MELSRRHCGDFKTCLVYIIAVEINQDYIGRRSTHIHTKWGREIRVVSDQKEKYKQQNSCKGEPKNKTKSNNKTNKNKQTNPDQLIALITCIYSNLKEIRKCIRKLVPEILRSIVLGKKRRQVQVQIHFSLVCCLFKLFIEWLVF